MGFNRGALQRLKPQQGARLESSSRSRGALLGLKAQQGSPAERVGEQSG